MLLLEQPATAPERNTNCDGEQDLRALIAHEESVSETATLEDVYTYFQQCEHEYVAVLRGRIPVGLCSRSRVGFMMGSRFGFALNSCLPIAQGAVQPALLHPVDAPLVVLLQTALARDAAEFHHDVALVDEDGTYLGLIPVHRLAQTQTALFARQLQWHHEQQQELRSTNVSLFRHVNELRQSEARYRSLFESPTTSFALLNQDGMIAAANPRVSAYLGLVRNVPSRFRDYVLERHQAVFDGALSEASVPLAAARVSEICLRIPTRGERITRISVAWVPEIGQWALSLEDVTDERALQMRAHEKEKRSLLESLVGGVAHELNNKLTPILGFTGLIDGEISGEAAAGYAKLIGQSAQEAARIIQQLLHLSKPVRPQRELCCAKDLVEDTLAILKFRLRDAQVIVKCDLTEAPVQMYADPGQIKQVLINLCANAIDAMAECSLRQLTFRVVQQDCGVAITVRDTGVGISRENRDRIFHPFFTTKGPSKGTGLGLSISAAVVSQHGGRITLESTPGRGSEFTVWIPAGTNDIPAVSSDGSEPPGRRVKLSGPVLVVEDEEVIARLVMEIVRQFFDCEVEHVLDGLQAVRRCQRGRVGVVISDLRMPVMNGLELYQRLRDADSGFSGPFVVMSGNDSAPEFRVPLKAAGVPMLPKPFTPEQLVQVLLDTAVQNPSAISSATASDNVNPRLS